MYCSENHDLRRPWESIEGFLVALLNRWSVAKRRAIGAGHWCHRLISLMKTQDGRLSHNFRFIGIDRLMTNIKLNMLETFDFSSLIFDSAMWCVTLPMQVGEQN